MKVYQDGKSCRGIDAKITGRRAGGIRAVFENLDGQLIEAWFVRRKNRAFHQYEAIGWNYWIMPWGEK